MTINLKKGQRISLAKEAPGLTRLMCGLGWDASKRGPLGLFSREAANFDLDSSIICLDDRDRLKRNSDIVYFGNLRHPSNAITHLGDNLTGAGEGDDEQILIDLPQIPDEITKLVVAVNIYHCIARGQDFGQVKNAFVRLVNLVNNQEIARYNLSGAEYKGKTGMIMAEIYRHEGEWKMAAVGTGVYANGLEELTRPYT
ncbi:MAG: TerD family protein [Cyanobacteriota bacterium]|nr:TerD family protein [Cyanobacteriota bacterium]